MVPLQQLLGKEDQFFDLLIASAEQACESVRALKEFAAAPEAGKSLDGFAESRRKDKSITRQIDDLLCTHFVTALEREDIEALTKALYKIPKTVEKVGERILLAPQLIQDLDISRQIGMLEQATATVLAMTQELRKGPSVDQVKQQNEQLQAIEGEADKLLLDLLKELYASTQAGGRVLFFKDIFELLERVTDRCRDAGNVIRHIVMKNS